MADDRLTILALSPYHGGPRQEFLEHLTAHSRHQIVPLILPPRTWPWRLRGSALHYADEIGRLRRRKIDLLLASDLVDTSRLRALLPAPLRDIAIIQYFHDDVLSGDLKDRLRDEPLALTQLYCLLASNLSLVASDYHRQALLAGARRLMKTFPDAVPVDLEEALGRRLEVLPPGVDAAAIRAAVPRAKPPGPPVILWNHPWIDEQNPRMFFETLYYLEQDGLEFRLAAVGAAVRKYPEIFQEARQRLADRIIQFGYLPDRRQYHSTIRSADIVISAAATEWFPLAVTEAVIAGACPLVGRTLANPEVFGGALAGYGYRGPVDLRRRLAKMLTEASAGRPMTDAAALAALREELVSRYDWPVAARRFDAAFERCAGGKC